MHKVQSVFEQKNLSGFSLGEVNIVTGGLRE